MAEKSARAKGSGQKFSFVTSSIATFQNSFFARCTFGFTSIICCSWLFIWFNESVLLLLKWWQKCNFLANRNFHYGIKLAYFVSLSSTPLPFSCVAHKQPDAVCEFRAGLVNLAAVMCVVCRSWTQKSNHGIGTKWQGNVRFIICVRSCRMSTKWRIRMKQDEFNVSSLTNMVFFLLSSCFIEHRPPRARYIRHRFGSIRLIPEYVLKLLNIV